MPPDFNVLNSDPALLMHLGSGVWLMDDHRWALKVWEAERKQDHYTLIHADYHWDACYDFHEQPAEEAALVAASPEEVAELVAADERIRYDSFIAPAIKRGTINAVHFYCVQDGPGDNAFDEAFLQSCGATQVLHASPQELAAAKVSGPVIFDLCLDLFNRTEKWAAGDLWPDADILEFLDTVQHWVAQAELVTVSMSFNFSGSAADTRRLAELVVPRLLAYRGDA